MSIVQWDVPFVLTSKYGSINLNAASGERFLLNGVNCSSGADLRPTVDNIPSGDGSIVHDVFSAGYQVHCEVQLWKDNLLACGSDLITMFDHLQFHLNAMRHDTGRILWTPTGQAQRMCDQVRLTQRSIIGYLNENLGATVAFDLQSPFPYAMVAAQTTTHVNNGASFNFINTGTADFYPVIKVNGPTSAFNIANAASGLNFFFDSTLPGASPVAGGHYVELDFFRNTAYLDGSGANYKNGINIIDSDFFPITVEPTGNLITIVGASMDVLWQPAFA